MEIKPVAGCVKNIVALTDVIERDVYRFYKSF
jgi:hypothetical protein